MTPAPHRFDSLLRQLAHATEHSEATAHPDAPTVDPSAAAAAYIGQRLGPFIINEVLGVGGMGFVFGALDEPLGRRVALKVLRPELTRRASAVHEARLSAPLEHPHIARVYSAGTDSGLDWIAFERVPGRPLRDLLRGAPLAPDRALRILADLADALAHAHGLALIHRDIKPENAMVRPDGRAVLLDFGVAVPDAGLLTPTDRVGTPAYQPPWPAPPADPAALDRYAFAVLAHETFAGHRPIPGQRIRLSNLPDAATRRALERLLTRALQPPAPDDDAPLRASTIAATLAAALHRPTRRRRARIAVVAGAIIAATATLVALALTSPAPRLPATPALTPLTTRVDDIPITLSALAPDASHAAFVDASGLTVLGV